MLFKNEFKVGTDADQNEPAFIELQETGRKESRLTKCFKFDLFFPVSVKPAPEGNKRRERKGMPIVYGGEIDCGC